LIGFAGVVTAAASKLASATPATSPAPTMIIQSTQSGEVQSWFNGDTRHEHDLLVKDNTTGQNFF
jgi:hypothetical protein